MDENIYWIAAGVVAIVILPPLIFGIKELRTRRRERALGMRRKQKHRL